MISIIIPNKNEPRLQEVIDNIKAMSFDGEYEIIVSDDPMGNGKGWAIRRGLKRAIGPIICLLDGDMDIHPKMLYRLMPYMLEYDVVVGRKKPSGPLSRRLISRLSRAFICLLFGLKVDTQTGIKIFRNKEHIPEFLTDGWMFDAEILAKYKQKNSLIYEVEVDATISKKMGMRSLFKCLKEALSIWVSLRTQDKK